MSIVYLNGHYLPKAEAVVSVMDRGFLFGDGVYEVIPVYGGVPLCLSAHLQRLENSMQGIQLSNPHGFSEWQRLIQTVIDKNASAQQSIYLQVTRGAPEKRDHAFAKNLTPTIFIMSTPIDAVPAQDIDGLSACLVEDIRWDWCHIKSTALLGNVLLKQKALDAGCDEAILLRGNQVTECSASNVFIVHADSLITPPKSQLLLPGITRDLVIQLARTHGIAVEERSIDKQALFNADEVWMSSSTKTIRPFTQLDGKPVGNGRVGKLWATMRQHYADYVNNLTHEEL